MKKPDKWNEDDFKQFDYLTKGLSSLNQLERIEARLELPKFIERVGKDVCDAMFYELKKRDAKRKAKR